MTDIKFDIIKTTVTAKTRKLNAAWHIVSPERIKPKFRYERGNPAWHWSRWTDDLGIILDKNQWVEERDGGWYSEIDPQDYYVIREWCEQNLKQGDWYTGVYYVFLKNEKDVSWFMLRWS